MNRLTERVRKIWSYIIRDSLYRNSFFLMVTLALNATSGFLFTLICVHFYSQQDVGYATAIISLAGLAFSLASLGAGRTIARFIGNSKTKSQDLSTFTLIVALCSIISGFGLVYFIPVTEVYSGSIKLVSSIFFVVMPLLMSTRMVFDSTFIALRDSFGNLIAATYFNLAKIAVVLLPVVVSLGMVGILGAQVTGLVIGAAVSIMLIHRRLGLKLMTRPSRRSMSGKWSFALSVYANDLVGGVPASVLPVIVVSKFGGATAALWYISMQITNFILMISSSINQAMFAEISFGENNILSLIKRALLGMYAVVVPLVILTIVFASQILWIFGSSYRQAAGTLKLMALFALLGVANYVSGSVLMFYKKTPYLIVVNIVNLLVVLIYVAIFARDLTGVAIGWMFGEVVNIALLVGGCLYFVRRNIKIIAL